MRKYVNGKYEDFTEAEIKELEHAKKKQMAQEKHRQLKTEEIMKLLIKQQINTHDIDDQTSVRMLDYYPTFTEAVGQEATQGFKFTLSGKLYKVIQPSMTITDQYTPGDGTESLYEVINEAYDGDLYDPIPYEGNMALESGKYYTQGDITYLCTRDTGIAVYNALSDLTGVYVKIAERG